MPSITPMNTDLTNRADEYRRAGASANDAARQAFANHAASMGVPVGWLANYYRDNCREWSVAGPTGATLHRALYPPSWRVAWINGRNVPVPDAAPGKLDRNVITVQGVQYRLYASYADATYIGNRV